MDPFYTVTIGRSSPWVFDTLDDAREAAREWTDEGQAAHVKRWTPKAGGYEVEQVPNE